MGEKRINEIISKNLNRLLERNGKNQADLAIYMGVSQATASNWCKGIKIPRMDKIDKICEFLSCTRSDLMDDSTEESEPYYINEDARDMAQFLFENPDYRVLFSAARNVSKEDLETVKAILDKFKGDDN